MAEADAPEGGKRAIDGGLALPLGHVRYPNQILLIISSPVPSPQRENRS
ncbi:MAG: hypothetical protein KME31_12795 [Tolypothrix carrinoi HA7290-LM1]|nr:hypothetical protein [Tolypothrix carrinoi HA7290-LM1]